MSTDFPISRGGGTGGAGGAIAPPTFVILLSNQPLAPPTILVGSVNSSTANFSYLPPPLKHTGWMTGFLSIFITINLILIKLIKVISND